MPMRPVLAGAPAADPRRGEIYEVNLDPAKGREQKGRRPCLVVSTDALNASGLGTVIVCTLTTKERTRFQWRPPLDVSDLQVVDRSWQPQRSWVQTDQLVTLDTEDGRFVRHLATVTNKERMVEITRWLRLLLGP